MNETDKILEEAIKKINKKYESNSVMKVGEMEYMDIETFSTGSYGLNYIMGCKGLPKGRIVEIYGEPSMGKTSVALFILGEIQKQGGRVMFIDAEMSFSKDYAEKLGVDVNNLYLNLPTTGEEALNIVDEMAKTEKIDVIVIDSVSSLVPAKELEGGIEKENYALQARMLSKSLRILTGSLARSKTTVIFLNQIRQKMNIMFGSPNTTSGGKALRFYSSIRLEVKGKKIKDKSDEVIGSRLSITATKNKTGVPWRNTEVDLIFGHGIDLQGDLLDFSEKHEVVKKEGNTYMFGEIKIGASRDKAKDELSKNKELFDKIKKELDTVLKSA